MNEKPTILDFDECYSIGSKVSEIVFNNVRTKLNRIYASTTGLTYVDVLSMELGHSDEILSDYNPTVYKEIENLFREEYRTLDELQKHCLFLSLMTAEKNEDEIVSSMLWTFEEELEEYGRNLLKGVNTTSVNN